MNEKSCDSLLPTSFRNAYEKHARFHGFSMCTKIHQRNKSCTFLPCNDYSDSRKRESCKRELRTRWSMYLCYRHLGLELNANVRTDENVIAGKMKKNNASDRRELRTTTPVRRDGTAAATVAFLQKQWRRGPWARWIFHRVAITERTAVFHPFLYLIAHPIAVHL